MLRQAMVIAIVFIITIGSIGAEELDRKPEYGITFSALPLKVQPYTGQYIVAGHYYSGKSKFIYVLTHKKNIGQIAWAIFLFDAYDRNGNPTNASLIRFLVLNKDELYIELVWRKKPA